MSDSVAVMNAGRFEQIGTPQELYHAPAHRLRRRLRRRQQPLAGPGRVGRTAARSRVELPDGATLSSALAAARRRRCGRSRSRSSCGPRRSRSREPGRAAAAERREPAARARSTACSSTAPNSRVLVRTAAAQLVEVDFPRPRRRRGAAAGRGGRARLGARARRPCFPRRGADAMPTQDAGRLSLILLLTPFLLWIVLLIVLPHLGIVALSLREKLGAARVHATASATTPTSSASRSTGTRCSAPR